MPFMQLLFFSRPPQAFSRRLHPEVCGQALRSSGRRPKLQALQIQQRPESEARAEGEPRPGYRLFFVVWRPWRQHWYPATLSSSREVHPKVNHKVQEKSPSSVTKCVSLYLSVLLTSWRGSAALSEVVSEVEASAFGFFNNLH